MAHPWVSRNELLASELFEYLDLRLSERRCRQVCEMYTQPEVDKGDSEAADGVVGPWLSVVSFMSDSHHYLSFWCRG